MSDRQGLLDYIAIHDSPCPNCFANLRGHVEDVCPACDSRLFLGSVRAIHVAFGDARSEPVVRPRLSHLERVAEYLSKNDAPCPGCSRNLRGQPGPDCPACKRRLYFKELRAAHVTFGDSASRPMPVPGSPESQRLDAYLSKNNVDCPGCGYELHGLVGHACPECGTDLNLPALMFSPPVPSQRYRVAANTVAVLSSAPIAITLLVVMVSLAEATFVYDRFVYLAWGLLLLLLLYAFVLPGRRLMFKNMWWAMLFNPLTAIVGVFAIGICMYVAFN